MSDTEGESLGQESGQTEGEKPQFSAIEERAMQMGWRPREEFSGDEEDFVDAKEFVGRQPFFEKISAQNAAIKNLQTALEALKNHTTKVRETEFNRAMKELKAQQSQAIRDGDADAYDALEAKREQVELDKQEFMEETGKIKVEDAPQVSPALQSWINRNPWYTNPDNAHMKLFADKLGNRLAQKVNAGELTQAQALKQIEEQTKEEFPNKFRNANRDKPGAVEGAGKTSEKSTSKFSLTPEETSAMNLFVRQGLMTKDEYIADLKKQRSVK